tara:strand:- start:80 stop:472 length:393 start_codon:yes stop_codon:yes gene_type:complete
MFINQFKIKKWKINLKSRMKTGISYHHLYNDVYSSKRPVVQMKSWIRKFYQKPASRTLKNIKKLLESQSIAQTFKEDLVGDVIKAQNFLELRKYFACKKIQKTVLQWLWKPEGLMFQREMKSLPSFIFNT